MEQKSFFMPRPAPNRPYFFAVSLFFILCGPVIFSHPARADLQFLPESRHQQYLTYGLFTDEHTSAVLRDSRRAYADLSVSIALFEMKNWGARPQLIAHCTAASAYRFNDAFNTLLTETVDAKVGLAVEFELTPDLRISAGWTHMSGHAVDNISTADLDLFGPNLGDESLPVRVVYDIENQWRFGGTLKPVIGADPKMKAFAADQFAEWFPWGVAANFRSASPYLAGGLEQYGVNDIQVSYHAQAGVFFGNHFKPEHRTSFRAVTGYYNGMDPRLKYFQFRRARDHFVYLGVMMDI